MDYERKTRRIANSYYNQGLERAEIRDLTGAVESLKKSLHFNKYHTDARNMLGLIYYEIGETAEALVQWVISMNLQPGNNRAEYYMEELRSKPGGLDAENNLARKYNQALSHAQGGSDDLAVLQLTKVVEAKPSYVKAQLLLALLHIRREEYAKAGKCLYRVLQTDRANPKAQWYMTFVKVKKQAPKTSRPAKVSTGTEPEKKKRKNVFSHYQMQDDDIILPPSYKENTRDQAVLNIIIGLVLGVAVIFFLVMPALEKSINVKHNKELLAYSEQISQANQKADQLSAQIAGLEEARKTAEDTLSVMTNDSGSILNQYKILINILDAYKKNDFNSAVLSYAALDQSMIVDADLNAIIAEIKTDMDASGYQVLESLGDSAAGSGDAAAALDYYLKSLNIKNDNWPLKYKTAMMYKETNQKDAANDLFTDIITNSGDEALSAQAQTERGF